MNKRDLLAMLGIVAVGLFFLLTSLCVQPEASSGAAVEPFSGQDVAQEMSVVPLMPARD
jgi:hypothetical protein